MLRMIALTTSLLASLAQPAVPAEVDNGTGLLGFFAEAGFGCGSGGAAARRAAINRTDGEGRGQRLHRGACRRWN